jgi:hypothetical protein
MKKIVLFQIIGMHGLILFSQNYVDVNINQPDLLKANAGIDITIEEGTTIQIGGSPTATYGYGNYTYAWAPSVYLSDAAGSNPDATLQNSTIYFVTVTDAMECTSSDSIIVTVTDATDIQDQFPDYNIKIVPNPNEGKFIIEMDNTTLITGTEIIIRNINGKMLYNRIMGIQEGKIYIPVNMSTLPKGNYIIEINNECLHYIEKLVVY